MTATNKDALGIDPIEEKRKEMIKEQEEALEKFREWQRVMWIQLAVHIKKWEEEKRPNFCSLYYESASKLHLAPYLIEFRIRAHEEQHVKEDLHRDH